MRWMVRASWIGVVALLVCGCATTQPSTPSAKTAVATTKDIRNKLVGTWQYEERGIKVEVTYTPSTVTLPGVPPTPYTLNGNEIVVDILGSKASIIEFHGKDEMTQTNKSDGQRYVFKRKRT
jgi:hypothetical protein